MQNIKNQVNVILQNSIVNLYGNVVNVDNYCTHYGQKTDFQFNKINALAKELGAEVDDITDHVTGELRQSHLLENVTCIYVKSQVFITFDVRNGVVENLINEMYTQNFDNVILQLENMININSTIVVDFSSPNLIKSMHVGHLRSTIIGESICRVFENCGANVKRVNHIGDWGTQFGMVIAYIKLTNPTDYSLDNLMQMYKDAKKLFDTDNDFKSSALAETVKLQQGDVENTNLWRKLCDISIESFNHIYEQLNTHADIKGESFYQSRMIDLVEDLAPIIVERDGRKLIYTDGYEVPLILTKSDGGFTYDTSDLAALRYRIFEERADKIIYVVDSGQKLHFEILFKVANDLGWAEPGQLQHVGFGVVLGPDGKRLKTRSGETIKLQDLIDQAYAHAKKITTHMALERHPEWNEAMIDTVSKKIAINCIKYADLSNPRINDYKYNLERMLNLKGNTGVYLMYAMARCKSIMRKIPNLHEILNGQIVLENADAKNLAFKILKMPDALSDCIENLSPHYLCNYLYDLIGTLTKFYDRNRCIEFGPDNQIVQIFESRIRLIHLTVMIISKLFDLIGLEHVEQI